MSKRAYEVFLEILDEQYQLAIQAIENQVISAKLVQIEQTMMENDRIELQKDVKSYSVLLQFFY